LRVGEIEQPAANRVGVLARCVQGDQRPGGLRSVLAPRPPIVVEVGADVLTPAAVGVLVLLGSDGAADAQIARRDAGRDSAGDDGPVP